MYSSSNDQKVDVMLVMCPGWGVSQPPIGISYLKNYLKKHDIKAKCLDLSLDLYKQFKEKKYWELNNPEYFVEEDLFNKYIMPELLQHIDVWAKQILEFSAEFVGFSLYMSSVNVSMLLARRLKQLRPGIKIIAGGPEVTRIKNILLNNSFFSAPVRKDVLELIDVLVEGEGEQTLAELLVKAKQDNYSAADKQKFLSSLENIPGLFYKYNSQVVSTGERQLLPDLDQLAMPDFSDFSLNDYKSRVLPFTTSRGCVNRCTFCADSPLWKTYRCLSPEKVVNDMSLLKRQYKRNVFEIVDSILNGDIGRLEKICDLILETRLDIDWSAKASLSPLMDKTLLSKMRKAGCRSLSYGLESGSPEVLKSMRKNIDLKQAKRILQETKQADIEANCFFIIGYPTEQEQDFQLTLDFIEENAKNIQRFDQVTGCHIEEDSYLGRNLEKFGIEFRQDGWYCGQNTPAVRRQRLQRFKEKARSLHKHYECEVQN